MLGIVPNKDSEFNDMIKIDESRDATDDFIKGMATCHSLTVIEDKLSGDPIDLRMFEFSRWTLLEGDGLQWQTSVKPPGSALVQDNDEICIGDEIGIIKQFQFSSDHQSMSVIVRDLSTMQFKIFCKGSPEKMKNISRPESIPEDFQEVLDKYTESGYRVIALGTRELPSNSKLVRLEKLERHEIEKDLTLLGLIVFENRIKSETKPVIEKLHRAKVRTIMVTGDHIQTALSVAKECQMIDAGSNVVMVKAYIDEQTQKPSCHFHSLKEPSEEPLEIKKKLETKIKVANIYNFAIDGPSFNVIRDHFPEVYDRICTRGTVFARMTPDQKEFLIEELQELGYYVGMCGDGANDCGALKAAHAGISLSDAEASVASPFTSKQANISCVPELIREGRAALITSFGIFKYMAAYSLTQYVSVIIMYEYNSNLTDLQYLYIDLFLITIFAFFFGLTKAHEGELAKRPPNNSLIHAVPILSLMLQMITIVGFQMGGLILTESQDWFVAFDPMNPGFTNTTAEESFDASTIEIKEVSFYLVTLWSVKQIALHAHAFRSTLRWDLRS